MQLFVQELVERNLIGGQPLTRQDHDSVEEFIHKVSILLLKSLGDLNTHASGVFSISFPEEL